MNLTHLLGTLLALSTSLFAYIVSWSANRNWGLKSIVLWRESLHSSSRTDDTWEKVLMTDAASQNGAVCLDGSPGGYYIRRSNNDENNWIIFHQGGGWCGPGDMECLGRSKGRLGSSKGWPSTMSGTKGSTEGSQVFSNPLFENYTIVFAMYCDGTSWTSNVDQPVKVSNTNETIYYRGRRLLDALIDNLSPLGLNNASTLLYSGCSAGALTAFLHIDYVSSRLSPTTKVLGLADAMFSLDRSQMNGRPGGFQNQIKWGYGAWNSSYSINDDCKESYGKGSAGWKCMFGEHVSMFVKTPVFILNSKYDPWQRNAILGIKCDIGINCPKPKERSYVAYGRSMAKALEKTPAYHGYFAANCVEHCQSNIGRNWNEITINNVTMRDAFLLWYTDNINKNSNNESNDNVSIRLVDKGDVKPTGTNVCPKRRDYFSSTSSMLLKTAIAQQTMITMY